MYFPKGYGLQLMGPYEMNHLYVIIFIFHSDTLAVVWYKIH